MIKNADHYLLYLVKRKYNYHQLRSRSIEQKNSSQDFQNFTNRIYIPTSNEYLNCNIAERRQHKLHTIELNSSLLGKKINKYAEPFVGGGAVLFDILSRYKMKDIYISDINEELITTYCVVRDDVDKLIKKLKKLQKEYIERGS